MLRGKRHSKSNSVRQSLQPPLRLDDGRGSIGATMETHLRLLASGNGNIGAMEARLRQDTSELVPQNTDQAYDPKITEFLQFCKLYSNNPRGGVQCDTVTPEKIFKFIWYQCYREKKPPGRVKKRRRIC
jgi:hypothetical protein